MARKKNKTNIISRLFAFLTVILALIIILIIVSLCAFIYYNSPPGQSGSNISSGEQQDGIKKNEDGSYYIDVRRGESAQSVGLRLEKAGLIRNRHFWYLICRLADDYLKSGTYRLEAESLMAIHRVLVSGRQILYRVTIPEGVTLKKTAKILEDAGICSADDFLAAANDSGIISLYRIPNDTMEGYLFPDTYLFPADYPASQVTKSMADNFFKKIELIYPSVFSMPPEELNQKVIIASIVEREYRLPEEAPLMSGVFYNRLRLGMALQSCATVEYIITEIQDRPHPSVLLTRDLEIRSPYNTYLIPGLPPSPISAPGDTSLKAAFSPSKNDFLYFRLDDPNSGQHYFSKTLDEHIKAGQLVPKGRS